MDVAGSCFRVSIAGSTQILMARTTAERSTGFMRNRCLCFVLVLVLGGTLYPSALAQDQSSARGNLSGLVYDSTKAVVPGAQVTITGPIGSLTQTTTEEGSFLFSTLIPGNYSLKVQKAGFKVASFKSAEVLINKTTTVEVILETGKISESVEVSAASTTVDTTATSVNSDFRSEEHTSELQSRFDLV